MHVDDCHSLPKIELHAHLNGSITPDTLLLLGSKPEDIKKFQSLEFTTNRSLEECFRLFKFAHMATQNCTSLYKAVLSVIDDFYQDNVIYLELRTTPRNELQMTYKEYIETVVSAIKNNDKNIVVKLLLSIDRSKPFTDDMLDTLIKSREMHPDIIKGVDFSGNVKLGNFNPNTFTQLRLSGFRTAIHCAEERNYAEIKEILLFGPDRIGHGTHLHPKYGGSEEIWSLYNRMKPPVECCLTSNLLCNTVPSYDRHHIAEWISNGLPFCLSTDDKGVFNTTLSHEYYQCGINYNLTLKQLLDISLATVDYSFACMDEKALLRETILKYGKSHGLLEDQCGNT